jgi:hypothetical protein
MPVKRARLGKGEQLPVDGGQMLDVRLERSIDHLLLIQEGPHDDGGACADQADGLQLRPSIEAVHEQRPR